MSERMQKGFRPDRLKQYSQYEPQYPASLWISADSFSLDDSSGTITGTADKNLVNPAEIGAGIILKWGTGATSSDLVIASTSFGGTRGGTTALDAWGTEFYGSFVWRNLLTINSETVISDVIRTLCAQAPLGWARQLTDGKHYCFPYPRSAPASNSVQRYLDSDSAIVYFRPDTVNPRAGDIGKPYTLYDFRPALTPKDEIYNRFRLRYRFFHPAGRTMASQVVTETAGDCNVWSSTTHSNDGTTSALNTAGLSYDLDAVCASSQSRYGVTNELAMEADTIVHHDVATAFLHYLIKRYSQQRHRFTVTAGMSAIDLEPGMIVRFSNDCNLVAPRMDYWLNPAQSAGWAVLDFLVLNVVKNLNAMTVRFTVEQIVYDPS